MEVRHEPSSSPIEESEEAESPFPRKANFHPKAGCPHPVSGLNLPLVIGHEFSGTIEAVGSSLQGQYKAGQKVSLLLARPGLSELKNVQICAQPDFGCGECSLCNSGNRNTCPKMGFVGLSGPPGGLGEYTTLKPSNFHVLPDNIPLDVGAMIEPLGELARNYQPSQSILTFNQPLLGMLPALVVSRRATSASSCVSSAGELRGVADTPGQRLWTHRCFCDPLSQSPGGWVSQS
jgi:hypothetical protein